jgi:hypothetical protein
LATDNVITESRIASIQVRHNGYLTRSTLEARWMVFLDLMGIAYEYEPEGLILHDGTRYLPDLYLPETEFWAEIKPTRLTLREEQKFAKVVLDFQGVGR